MKVEGKMKITILLDIRADINIITAKVADAVNLSIFEIIPIETEIFTGYNAQLIKIYREVNV
jgi:hypothetical protein